MVLGIALATGAFFAFAVTKALQAQRRPPTTGLEGMVGRIAEARTDLDPHGSVFLMGEWWDAVAVDPPLRKGELVEVVGSNGFVLQVRRKTGDDSTPNG